MQLVLIAFIVGTLVVAGLFAAAIFGFVLLNIVPLAIAILGGLALSAFVGGGPSAGTTTIAALVIFLALRSRSRRQRRHVRRNFDVEATATETPSPQSKPRSAATASTDPLLDTAFAALAENADWARSRIAVAQESCRLFLRLADRQPFDTEAGDLAVRIRKRIPEHVAECIESCEAATASERRVILDEAVFTLEKVGAEADRHRTRLMGPASEAMNVQRQHLTRRSEAGPFDAG